MLWSWQGSVGSHRGLRLLAVVGVVVVVVVSAAACGGGGSQPSPPVEGTVDPPLPIEMAMEKADREPGPLEDRGVWVIGEGSVMVEPDLALLGLGVEARADTVGAAREQAAEAMAAVVTALKRLGVADLDVQTRSFDIDPIYDYFEEFDEVTGRHTGREVLTGYRVSNLASVKVRDLERVGEMIDAAAEAGGDAVRINGVRFTVEDTEPFTAALREDAFTDALAKAEHFASLAGVSLGKLVRIHEASGLGSTPKPSPRHAPSRQQRRRTVPSRPHPSVAASWSCACPYRRSSRSTSPHPRPSAGGATTTDQAARPGLDTPSAPQTRATDCPRAKATSAPQLGDDLLRPVPLTRHRVPLSRP